MPCNRNFLQILATFAYRNRFHQQQHLHFLFSSVHLTLTSLALTHLAADAEELKLYPKYPLCCTIVHCQVFGKPSQNTIFSVNFSNIFLIIYQFSRNFKTFSLAVNYRLKDLIECIDELWIYCKFTLCWFLKIFFG